MFAPDDHNKLTCRKSTSGMKRAHIPFGLQNRRTSDSQILIPDQKSKTSQTLGLKLVFKRQSGDKYEISSPLSSSGTAEAHKKVKFSFDEENDNTDQQEEAKVENEQIPFEPSDLVEKDDELVAHILKNQPRVKITHSIPFPIALVEDKTNIVHTKALLLIHLYKSFSSPCIICVLCKCFFSINDFSKHFHLSEEDLFDEDDEEDEETHGNITDDSKPIDAQKKTHVNLNLEQRREKKLAELRKKSFKILPYCLNKNNELNEDQLKIWKIFGERYTTFKRTHQQSITLKPKTNSIETKSSLKKKHTVDSLNKEKDKENKTDISNWDYIDVEKKTSYFITRERLECERIIFLNPSITQSIQNMTNKKDDSLENEADLHLSEEESDSEKEKETEKKISTVIEKPEYIEDNSYLFLNMPTRIEKCFNYYDNLSHHIRCFIESSPHIITPQSLISFNITNRLKNYKFLLLSQDRSFKLKWLCSSLDLHQSKC